MFYAYIKNTDSMFGEGDSEESAIIEAKKNYLEKYPEELECIDDIEWSVLEVVV